MTQSFKQYIYCGRGSNHNFPLSLSAESLVNGSFLDSTLPISQLGISSLPGTKIYLNGGSVPVIVGFTGLFEIDLSASGGEITDIRVDPKSISEIERNDSAYLVIDIAYWGA